MKTNLYILLGVLVGSCTAVALFTSLTLASWWVINFLVLGNQIELV